MPYVNLRHTQVILDPDNPRLPDGTSSDREAINRLLDEGPDALINLARDMAQSGQTNPAELPIAIKHGSKYLILEGNRRFAALKLLNDPALAENEVHQRAFRRAAALGAPPKTVFTLVAPSREEADRWIVLRHTGENRGVGIKRWSAAQTATHRRRASKTVDAGTLRSITIADELEEAYALDAEIVDLARRARREKLTNIGRFFSPDVLSSLLLVIEVDTSNSLRLRRLWAHHDAVELRDFFAWALRYILDNSVDAYKNAHIRSEALRSASHLIPGSATATERRRLADVPFAPPQSEPTSAAGSTPGEDDGGEGEVRADGQPSTVTHGGQPSSPQPETDESQTSEPPRKKGEARPERFMLQALRLPNHNERVQRLLKECRSLALDDYPGVACVMLRVIVELSVSSREALSLSGSKEQDPLKDKILSMLRYLDPNVEKPAKRDRELAQAFLETTNLGVQYLHGFVHNPSVYPDSHLARRFSQAFRPLLQRVDQAL